MDFFLYDFEIIYTCSCTFLR